MSHSDTRVEGMFRGPCAKRRVFCIIEHPAGLTFVGENGCANPQTVCPRLPGEDYEKCARICGQSGHAELQALKSAGPYAAGATARLQGHYWMCEPCGRALREAGITSVTIELAP